MSEENTSTQNQEEKAPPKRRTRKQDPSTNAGSSEPAPAPIPETSPRRRMRDSQEIHENDSERGGSSHEEDSGRGTNRRHGSSDDGEGQSGNPRHSHQNNQGNNRRRRRRGRNNPPQQSPQRVQRRNRHGMDDYLPEPEERDGPPLNLFDLQKLSVPQLIGKAEEMEVEDPAGLRKSELINEIVLANMRLNGPVFVQGILEVMQDGFGFLRSPLYNYLSTTEDIFVSPSQIRKYGLRYGDFVEGDLRTAQPKDRFFGLGMIHKLNGEKPQKGKRGVIPFEHLTPLFPEERLMMERSENPSLPMRVIDLVAPIGKGQRGLIVAPPRTGKTVLLQDIANSISANHPEVE
ncbi:MAG: Rho termination factor N-terminal domain-containing protein, partial [Kiritimatiellia bacterium]